MWIDAHAHITSLEHSLIDAVMKRAEMHRVGRIINICTTKQEVEFGLTLQKKYPMLELVGSTTPHDVDTLGKEFGDFATFAKEKKLIAIGETGLDYHYEHSERELQKQYLLQYIDLALRLSLPLVIHCREAFSDLFSLLDTHYFGKKGQSHLILHCFTGTKQEVKELIDRGAFISFSGIVTFKKSADLREVINSTPSDRILIETDTPYLAPVPMRGKQNEPSFLPFIGEVVAKEKSLELQEVEQLTWENTHRAFLLK